MMLTVPSVLPAAHTASTPPAWSADATVLKSAAPADAAPADAGACEVVACDAAACDAAGCDAAGAGVAAAPLHADTAKAATARPAMARDLLMSTNFLLCVAPCPARSLDRCLGGRTMRRRPGGDVVRSVHWGRDGPPLMAGRTRAPDRDVCGVYACALTHDDRSGPWFRAVADTRATLDLSAMDDLYRDYILEHYRRP